MRLESFVDRSNQSFRRMSSMRSFKHLNDNSPPKPARAPAELAQSAPRLPNEPRCHGSGAALGVPFGRL